MPKKQIPIHPAIKKSLGYKRSEPDRAIYDDWKERTRIVCKPCWELKYCPYGPVVEDYPLLPPTRASSEAHNQYLRECLRTGKLANGKPVDERQRRLFKAMMKSFRPSGLPEAIPPLFLEVSCRVFGHICPVFFVAEPFTETKDMRSLSRQIPREVMLKVIRRDGQICQKCHEPVRDDQVEFDHIIPYSKGGTATAENLRLVHRDCNRKKGASLEELLAENPIARHVTIVRSKRKED